MTMDPECQARSLPQYEDDSFGTGTSSPGSDLKEDSPYKLHSQHPSWCGPECQLNSLRSILVAFVSILKRRKIPGSFASLYN